MQMGTPFAIITSIAIYTVKATSVPRTPPSVYETTSYTPSPIYSPTDFYVEFLAPNLHCLSPNVNFVGYDFANVSECAREAMTLTSYCTDQIILWSPYYSTMGDDGWGCYCCELNASYVYHANWDLYHFGFVTAAPSNYSTSSQPTVHPTSLPSLLPSSNPTPIPSSKPSLLPSLSPSPVPSLNPTTIPSSSPTIRPTHGSSIIIESTFTPSLPSDISNPTNSVEMNITDPYASKESITLLIILGVVLLCIFFCVFCIFIQHAIVEERTHRELMAGINIESTISVHPLHATCSKASIAPLGKPNQSNGVRVETCTSSSNHQNGLTKGNDIQDIEGINLNVTGVTISTQIAEMDTPRGVVSDVSGMEVRRWLTDTVKEPQYVDAFLSNGFHTLKSVMAIDHREQLNEIGITLVGHQCEIWHEIKELKKSANNQEGALPAMMYDVSNTLAKSDTARSTRL